MSTVLLVIDPQEDFCSKSGALSVPGADEDMRNLASFIGNNSIFIDELKITLDSHREMDIAHPIYWVNQDGEHPAPFTIISYEDVSGDNPKWKAANEEWQERSVQYVKKLNEGGRYPLCIWPPHCILGTDGHAVSDKLTSSLAEWENENNKSVEYYAKGLNQFTENYSVFKAEVPDPEDEQTQWNSDLAGELVSASLILVAGEALSHCVANSIRDLVDIVPPLARKIIVMTDTTSSVPGFEELGEQFIKEMKSLGVQFKTTTQVERML